MKVLVLLSTFEQSSHWLASSMRDNPREARDDISARISNVWCICTMHEFAS